MSNDDVWSGTAEGKPDDFDQYLKKSDVYFDQYLKKSDVYIKNEVYNKNEVDTSISDINNILDSKAENKSDIGLANVENTSDANKPISTATQNVLDAKSNNSDVIKSIAGTPIGGDRVENIISLTQAEYDSATKIASTLYLITDA